MRKLVGVFYPLKEYKLHILDGKPLPKKAKWDIVCGEQGKIMGPDTPLRANCSQVFDDVEIATTLKHNIASSDTTNTEHGVENAWEAVRGLPSASKKAKTSGDPDDPRFSLGGLWGDEIVHTVTQASEGQDSSETTEILKPKNVRTKTDGTTPTKSPSAKQRAASSDTKPSKLQSDYKGVMQVPFTYFNYAK